MIQWQTIPKSLTDSDYEKLSHLTEEDYQQFNQTLDHLLIPRVPGSDEHKQVREVSLGSCNIMKAQYIYN